MNRQSSSRTSHHVRAGLVAVAGCLFAVAMSGTGTAFAGGTDSGDATPSVRVSYAGLDLASDEGARILYRRIASAAERVCENPGSRELTATWASRRCERKAIARAIAQVGNPKLAAILASATVHG